MEDMLNIYNRVQIAAETNPERPLPNTVEDLGDNAVKFLRLVTQYLPPKEELEKPIFTLDLGCNTGYNTKMLKEKYGHCAGIDLNEVLVKKAIENGNECYVLDMHHVNDIFPDNCFSLIFAKDVIEHSYDPFQLLLSLWRILKPNGYLIAFIPMDGGDNPRVIITTSGGNPAHVWKTNYKDCKLQFGVVGFKDVQIHKHSVQKDIGYVRPIGDDIGVILARK